MTLECPRSCLTFLQKAAAKNARAFKAVVKFHVFVFAADDDGGKETTDAVEIACADAQPAPKGFAVVVFADVRENCEMV